jgi:hypothetical protein
MRAGLRKGGRAGSVLDGFVMVSSCRIQEQSFIVTLNVSNLEHEDKNRARKRQNYRK